MTNRLLLLLFLPLISIGQVSTKMSLNSSVKELRDHIYNQIPEDLKQKKWERRTYEFADGSANFVYNTINDGNIALDWGNMENFVNMIMYKVLPEELKGDSIIHAYVRSNGSFNAFMTSAGIMFVNTGLISAMPDEATLAAVITHELAHYHLKHSLHSFLLSQSGMFNDGLVRNPRRSQFSVKNEHAADSLGFYWFKNSGYAISGFRRAFEIMAQKERNYVSHHPEIWEIEENTHPHPEKRLTRFDEHRGEETTIDEGEEYLISKRGFKVLRHQAKKRTLQNLLSSFKYHECIETAFKYHIIDISNADYVYFLMEGIRRLCYLDPSQWSENFITSRYFTPVEPGLKGAKVKMEDHLFVKLDPDILQLSPAEMSSIHKFYWEEEEALFKTYEQAFLFYYRIGKAMNHSEVVLSNALSVTHDPELRKTLLKEYLALDNVGHREFAEVLLNDFVRGGLRSKKLSIVSNFSVYINQGGDYIKLQPEVEDDSLRNVSLTKVFDQFEDRRLLYIEDLRTTNFAKYKKLKELELFSYLRTVSQGNRAELHILDPSFWETFMEYGVNEMDFFEINIVETRKGDKSKEAYDSILNLNYSDVLLPIKRSRDIQVLITSIREKKNCRMKFIYGDEYSLRFKEPCYLQLERLLKNNIDDQAKKITRADTYYQSYQ